jgi:hypothetical protein
VIAIQAGAADLDLNTAESEARVATAVLVQALLCWGSPPLHIGDRASACAFKSFSLENLRLLRRSGELAGV